MKNPAGEERSTRFAGIREGSILGPWEDELGELDLYADLDFELEL